MKQFLVLIAVVVAVSLSGSVHAESYTGNRLLQDMQAEKGTFGSVYSDGFVVGVIDAYRSIDHACVPPTVTKGQAIDVVKRFLESRPSKRHIAAAPLILAAMRNAFDCPGE